MTATETLLLAAKAPETRVRFGRASVVRTGRVYHITSGSTMRTTKSMSKAADLLVTLA